MPSKHAQLFYIKLANVRLLSREPLIDEIYQISNHKSIHIYTFNLSLILDKDTTAGSKSS